jgi:phospholipid/cholesterol/gamma-HCH transport system substrate-binding protein
MSHQIRTGIFVFIGLVLLMLSLFVVGGEEMLKSYVTLHAYFDQVQGLAPGSVVSLAGVRVGNVDKIQFIPQENKLDVFMKVDKSLLKRITEGSEVEIRTQGALGDKFVFIIPGSPTAPPVKDGDALPVAKSTDLMAILSEKAGQAGQLFDIISDVHKITQSIVAEGRLDQIMKDMSSATKDFRQAAQDGKQVISEIRSEDSKKLTLAIDKMNSILTKIDNGQGSLGALINDPSLHDSLKAMLGGNDRKKTIKSLIRSSIEKSDDHSD